MSIVIIIIIIIIITTIIIIIIIIIVVVFVNFNIIVKLWKMTCLKTSTPKTREIKVLFKLPSKIRK